MSNHQTDTGIGSDWSPVRLRQASCVGDDTRNLLNAMVIAGWIDAPPSEYMS